MSSFVEQGLELLVTRISELNILLNEADRHQSTSLDLYSGLCRSIQVLSVSHFEGYLKDLVKNILDDVNRNLTFSTAPTALKYTYCRKFIQPLASGGDNIGKIQELLSVFDGLDTKFQSDAFHQPNKNPKESIINNIAKNFGEKKLFNKLNSSDIIAAFSNTDQENIILKGIIISKLFNSIKEFPYIKDDSILNVNLESAGSSRLSEEFIQDILSERHRIAHGNMGNSTAHTTIRSNIVKMEILLLSITYLLCQKVIS